MALIDGTNGDDTLVGTALADTFNPMFGSDTVDGLAGTDLLNVNYSALTPNSSIGSTIYAENGSFYGTVYAGFYASSVTFSNIERLSITLDGSDNYLSIDAAPVATGGQLTLRGGGGFDTLAIDFSQTPGTTFIVNGSAVTSNKGSFAQFEQYSIFLGAGTNTVTTGVGNDQLTGTVGDDTLSGGGGSDQIGGNGGTNFLNGGDGDDYLRTDGGNDTIDGGAGTDDWNGAFIDATTPILFTYDGSSGIVAGRTKLTSVERASIYTGSGDDSFSITSTGYVYISGGDGDNSLTYDITGKTNYSAFSGLFLQDSDGGSFDGRFQPSGGFSRIGHVDIKLGADDDLVYLDAAPLAEGATLNADGGAGTDRLIGDFSAIDDLTFSVSAGGAISSTVGTFASFEAVQLTLGGGGNRVSAGANDDTLASTIGNDVIDGGGGQDTLYGGSGASTLRGGAGLDQIYSRGGVDTVDGGDGRDTWHGDYRSATNAITFTYNGLGGSVTGGTTLGSIESIDIATGSGDDTLTLTNARYALIDGGDGDDTLIDDQGTLPLDTFYFYSGISSSLGSFSGYVDGGYTYIQNIEHLDLTLDKGDNTFSIDAAAILSGATAAIDGGIGTDTIILDISAFDDVTFIVAANGSVSETIAGLSVAGFEGYSLNLGGGVNTVTLGGLDDFVNGGAGDDTVHGGGGTDTLRGFAGTNALYGDGGDDQLESLGGTDTIDGGTGTDRWQGGYYAGTADRIFIWNQATGAGTLTGSDIGTTTLTSIEAVTLETGSGNDMFRITGDGNFDVRGDAGNDTLVIDASGSGVGGQYVSQIYSSLGSFSGQVSGGGTFGYIEALTIGFGGGDDYVVVDPAAVGAGATLDLDGGAGNDTLALYAGELENTIFTVSPDGTAGGNVGAFANFENYTISVGDGTNSVTVGDGADILTGNAGDDTLTGGGGNDQLYAGLGTNVLDGGAGEDMTYSSGGIDTIDGGADFDRWYGTFYEATNDIALTYDRATASGTVSGGTTLTNIESVGIFTGSGDDSFTIAADYFYVDAGTGFDTLTYDGSGYGGEAGYSFTLIQSNGLQGFDGSIQGSANAYFYNVEALDLTFLDTDDLVQISDNTSLGRGATIALDGGLGNNQLSLDLTALSGTTFTLAPDGTITSNIAGFTAARFGSFQLLLGDGADVIQTGGGNDFILAGDGDDIIDAGDGTDLVDGGAGNDTLSFATVRGGITFDLGGPEQQITISTESGTDYDSVYDIENVTGSAFNDVIGGDGGDNVLDGGAGTDTLTYAAASAAVTVDLGLATAQATGSAGNDTISNFENVVGSAYGDRLTGDDGVNVITGGAGDDAIDGAGGRDTAVFSLEWRNYAISSSNGAFTIATLADGTDTVRNVERFIFADGALTAAQLINVGPTANADAAAVTEEGTGSAGTPIANGNLLANDTDPNLAKASPERLVVNGIRAGTIAGGGAIAGVGGEVSTQGRFGTLTVNPDGTYTYTLDNGRAATEALAAGQTEADIFTYRITDLHGVQSVSQIAISVTGADDSTAPPPALTDDSLYLTRNAASSLDATILLANDSGAAGESLQVIGVSNATGGTATLDGGRLIVTATDGVGGFDYIVAGSNGGLATGHVDFASIVTSGAGDLVVTPRRPYVAGDVQGQGGDDRLYGDNGRDHIVGGGGNDLLSGGANADIMEGGTGDDLYLVENAGDVVIEAANQGNDQITTLVSYTLSDNVEKLQLSGSAAIDGAGNDAANMIVGNAAANLIDGGLGADRLEGRGGDDRYIIDDRGDRVIEAAGGGTDTVFSSVTYALGANVENLTLTGTARIGGTGNALANVLTGNDAMNSLTGGAGADVLDGGLNFDTLTGGADADSFAFTTALSLYNVDRITDFTAGEDHIQLSSALFGLAPGTLAAEAFKDLATGAIDTDDRILYDRTTGALSYDADGDGSIAAVQFATIANLASLGAGDMFVI